MAIEFKKPHEIKAIYRIVTPMFIGGASQTADDGIRAASIKGALRFWWRVLIWGNFLSENNNNEEQALCSLHKQESQLFGTANNNGRQADVLLTVKSNIKADEWRDTTGCGTQYLMGQGLYHFREGILRNVIPMGESFEVKLLLKPSIQNDKNISASLKQACVLLGILGGLGSRARKGFGSIAIQSLMENGEKQEIPENTIQLQNFLETISKSNSQPPYTAFSNETRIDISATGNNALALLEKVGKEMQMYRSYGRNNNGVHQACGKQAEQNFSGDHDLVQAFTTGVNPTSLPERTVFGLPHNYFFSGNNASVDYSLSEQDNETNRKRERRSSPLFIHVHEFPDSKKVVIQSLFPSTFLITGENLEFKSGRQRHNIAFQSYMIDYGKITDYLDRFTQKEVLL